MNYHWNITDRLGFNIDYCPEEFIGIDLNAGYSELTGNFQIHFQLGALAICLTYYLGEE
jgi:hypothetical protein